MTLIHPQHLIADPPIRLCRTVADGRHGRPTGDNLAVEIRQRLAGTPLGVLPSYVAALIILFFRWSFPKHAGEKALRRSEFIVLSLSWYHNAVRHHDPKQANHPWVTQRTRAR